MNTRQKDPLGRKIGLTSAENNESVNGVRNDRGVTVCETKEIRRRIPSVIDGGNGGHDNRNMAHRQIVQNAQRVVTGVMVEGAHPATGAAHAVILESDGK